MSEEAYERARLSRDPRFDGRFFIAVKTTGIYCRPICPANSPKRENIDFYTTAAAASEAGFRPCLRCRPECAPGTPAWAGTSTTVNRGLRLIADGALEDGNVEQLSERLGVTSRHLRRLFNQHVGASPLAVAHTQRLHFAKRLIDQTRMPLQEIAIAAGYGSVRRFNDTFRKTYGRTPGDLRRRYRGDALPDTNAGLTVRLSYRLPYDWSSLLAFFEARAVPGVEQVVDGVYKRTLQLGSGPSLIEVRNDEQQQSVLLTLYGAATTSLFALVGQAREVFDLDAPIGDITNLLATDPLLKKLSRRYPGIRVPGAWDGFELTVRAILGQQISVKAATTLAGRIAARYGEAVKFGTGTETGTGTAECGTGTGGNSPDRLFATPEKLMHARFNNIGLVRSRAATIRAVARAVVDGDLRFDGSQSPDELREALLAIRGIGEWTAQYVAMRVLKNPDAFPAADLGLLRAFDQAGKPRLRPAELLQKAENWRPWRAYAARLLWCHTPDSGG